MARLARKKRPFLFHGVTALVLTLAVAVVLWWALSRKVDWQHGLGCWLVAINVTAFGYYGYDKVRARSALGRVPELVLHGLTAAGGSLGTYAAMRLFRHKTIKGKFRILFWCIVTLQLAIGAWIVKTVWWA